MITIEEIYFQHTNTIYAELVINPMFEGRVKFYPKDPKKYSFFVELILDNEVITQKGKFGLDILINSNIWVKNGEIQPYQVSFCIKLFNTKKTVWNLMYDDMVYSEYFVGFDKLANEIFRLLDFIPTDQFIIPVKYKPYWADWGDNRSEIHNYESEEEYVDEIDQVATDSEDDEDLEDD
jgi:hypothetical protein